MCPVTADTASLLRRGVRRIRSMAGAARRALRDAVRPVELASTGTCPTCCRQVRFVARQPWLRDHFICTSCGSIPRAPVLLMVVKKYCRDPGSMTIHVASRETITSADSQIQ